MTHATDTKSTAECRRTPWWAWAAPLWGLLWLALPAVDLSLSDPSVWQSVLASAGVIAFGGLFLHVVMTRAPAARPAGRDGGHIRRPDARGDRQLRADVRLRRVRRRRAPVRPRRRAGRGRRDGGRCGDPRPDRPGERPVLDHHRHRPRDRHAVVPDRRHPALERGAPRGPRRARRARRGRGAAALRARHARPARPRPVAHRAQGRAGGQAAPRARGRRGGRGGGHPLAQPQRAHPGARGGGRVPPADAPRGARGRPGRARGGRHRAQRGRGGRDARSRRRVGARVGRARGSHQRDPAQRCEPRGDQGHDRRGRGRARDRGRRARSGPLGRGPGARRGQRPRAGSNGAGPAGHGLAGLIERAHALGGTVEAAADPDGGFRLRVSVPAGAREIAA